MRAPAESRFLIEEVRSVERFRELEAEWDDLCDRAIDLCPTMRHAFLRGWLEAFGDSLELRMVLVRESGTLIASAPFAYRTERLLGRDRRVLGLLMNTWIDRSQPVLARADGALVDAILRHLGRAPRDFDLLAFGPLEASSAEAALLRASAAAQGWRCGEEVQLESPFLALPSTWDGLLERLSPAFRATLRRKVRQVEKDPAVTMDIVEDASCWDAIAAISPETWQAQQGTAMTSRPELSRLYETVVRDAARRGTLRCGLLSVRGTPVAFDFNLLERDVLYSFKMGFNQEHAGLSAGVVLKAHVLRSAIESPASPLRGYDFMGTAEPYKLHWASEVRSHVRQLLFAPGWRNAGTHWAFYIARPLLRDRWPRFWSFLKNLRGGA